MDSKNRLAIAIAITCLIVVAIFASFGRSLFFVHIPPSPSATPAPKRTPPPAPPPLRPPTSTGRWTSPPRLSRASWPPWSARTATTGSSPWRPSGQAAPSPPSVQYWQDRAWSHTRQDLASGAVRHDLSGPESAYYWYESSSAWNALPADERSHDLAQHIPTYETVLDLDPASITETGYELRGPYPCVYVAFQEEDSASVERYWISTDNGLLISAEREVNGELVYRMTAYGQVQIPCPATASFALPDGQVLHTV